MQNFKLDFETVIQPGMVSVKRNKSTRGWHILISQKCSELIVQWNTFKNCKFRAWKYHLWETERKIESTGTPNVEGSPTSRDLFQLVEVYTMLQNSYPLGEVRATFAIKRTISRLLLLLWEERTGKKLSQIEFRNSSRTRIIDRIDSNRDIDPNNINL